MSSVLGCPFAPNSPWRTLLPHTVPHDPNSAAIVQNLVAQVANNYGHGALNTNSWSAVVFEVQADQPTVDLICVNPYNPNPPGPLFAEHLKGVPMPANAFPDAGDLNVIIFQPSLDRLWEWGKLARNDATGVWSAAYGGRIDGVSRNTTGQYLIIPGGEALGVSASGTSMLASIIRKDELKAGVINHAIAMGVPQSRNVPSWPATRTDGTGTDRSLPMQGQKMQLDPTINVGAIPGVTEGEVIVLTAMQKYGIVPIDTAGVVAIYAEHDQGDPIYYNLFQSDSGEHLTHVPWGSLNVLPVDYGKPA